MTTIEVFADIWCPFTHVGLRRVVERRAVLDHPVSLRVHPWPLELVNGRPMDPGFIAEEVDDLVAQVAPDLFTGFRQDRFPTTTLPALGLAEAAYAQGLDTGEAVSLALRDALFEAGLDIGDRDVLAPIAATHGIASRGPVDDDAVLAGWETGRRRGVVGSPHFFTAGGGWFCPGLDIARVEGHLQISPDIEAFEAFVATL